MWSIAIIGFLTLVFMMMAMLVMVRQFNQSPYSNSTKLALKIRGEFHFESVGTGLRYEGLRRYIIVQYETHADSKFDQAAQTREMQKVAEFTAQNADSDERKRADEIRVQRAEVHGRGCFQQTFTAGHAIPNPFRDPNPGGFRPVPQNP